jgi:hypothetical protein
VISVHKRDNDVVLVSLATIAALPLSTRRSAQHTFKELVSHAPALSRSVITQGHAMTNLFQLRATINGSEPLVLPEAAKPTTVTQSHRVTVAQSHIHTVTVSQAIR